MSVVLALSGNSVENIAERVLSDPRSFPGAVVRSTGSGSTVRLATCSKYPDGVTYINADNYPRGVADLGWLSHARFVIKPLTAASISDLKRAGVPWRGRKPARPVYSSARLWGLNRRKVGAIDLRSAYLQALSWAYRRLTGTACPLDATGVPKQVVVSLWGGMASRTTEHTISEAGTIETKETSKLAPPIFWAVPHIVKAWCTPTVGRFDGIIWTDCYIGPVRTALSLARSLATRGIDFHWLEGRADLLRHEPHEAIPLYDLVITDTDTGEVVKHQAWRTPAPDPIFDEVEELGERVIVDPETGEPIRRLRSRRPRGLNIRPAKPDYRDMPL